MKIKNGFEIKEIADSFVAIPTQDNVVDFSSIIMLNETSAFLWLRLENDTTEDELLKALLEDLPVGGFSLDFSVYIRIYPGVTRTNRCLAAYSTFSVL